MTINESEDKSLYNANAAVHVSMPFKPMPWWKRLITHRWGPEEYVSTGKFYTAYMDGRRLEWDGVIYRIPDLHFGGYQYLVKSSVYGMSTIDASSYEKTGKAIFT